MSRSTVRGRSRTAGVTQLAIQFVLALIGVAALARGGYLFVTSVTPDQWVPSLVWLGAGIVVHDVVIAPVTLLLGRILRPGAAIRFSWLAAGTVVLLSIPLIQGAQARRNPTVIPGRPWLGLAISLGLIVAGALLATGVRRARRRSITRSIRREGAAGSVPET